MPIIKFELSSKNLKLGKILATTLSLAVFTNEIDGDINRCDVSILLDKCVHLSYYSYIDLEDLYNSENQCFLNEQCMVLQNHKWIKYLLNLQDKSIHFNITDYEKFIMVLDFTLQLISKKLPFVCWRGCREKRTLLYTVGGNVCHSATTMENSMKVP